PHVAGELFKMMAAVNTVHVPYRGQGPALTDLLAGQVQFYFAGIPSSIQYVRSAKLRALAVTTTTRSEALPEIPTLIDSCRVMSGASGAASVRLKARRQRRSKPSTGQSTLASPIP